MFYFRYTRYEKNRTVRLAPKQTVTESDSLINLEIDSDSKTYDNLINDFNKLSKLLPLK